MRILLVEDDEILAEALVKALTDQHYVIDVATDGQEGRELAENFAYDLLLLDVMLPKLNGISLCQQLRRIGNPIPIILLTVRDTSTDKVMGLDAGADDYVVKPFDLQELLARIRALLRRGSSTLPPVLEWRNLRLDPSSCEVTYQGRLLNLTPKEYSLLELFLRNSRRVFSQGAILEHLWSFEEPQEDTVRAHIKGLRQKLKAAGVPADFIETVYGLGYRLKLPLGSETTAPLPGTGESRTQQQTIAEVAGVWERFKEKFSNRVAVLEQATTALLKDALGDKLRQKAQQEAHKLAGSLGMFGFAEGSRLAREIEQIFQAKRHDGQDQALHLSELLVALRRELQQTISAPVCEPGPVDERDVLLVVSNDTELAAQLVMEAELCGMRAHVATDLSQARDAIFCDRPQVVLLDLCSPGPVMDSFRLLAELNTCTPPVPVLVLTAQDLLNNRVKVARLGGRGFLPKSMPSAQMLEAVSQVLQRDRTRASKVMAVDDDPQVLVTLRTLLEPWGLRIRTLDDPRRFWDILEESAPDLLVLDLEMPHWSGIELCQVVRNDPHWSRLPILFLSAHTDADTVNRVFAAGADDYVSKPIVGPELVTRIFNRLERSRLLRNMAEIDALTGVANRRKLTQELIRFLRLADHQGQRLCLAILELDHLKQINNQYGYAVGDRVLYRFGKLLRRAFRSEDVVGRWGGAEFVIGIYGMTRNEGVGIVREVLDTLRQEEFTGRNGNKFQVTFSAGVAQYPQDGSDLQLLYQAANAVLEQALLAGRNRVLPVG
jgi:diguanylate cyclase (GGDEF)-like protein